MDSQELAELLHAGEDSFTEFKRDASQRSDFAGEMIAFANSEGGRILVGVADDGCVVGVDNPQRLEEDVLNIARQNCNPPLQPTITRLSVEGQTILDVEIPRRASIPHENNSGQCFIRVGSTKRLATPHERARLLQLSGLIHYDETPIARTGVGDIDMEAFDAYYQRIYAMALPEADVPLTPMLENMRFIVRDLENLPRLSLAGLLLFGKHPQDFVYHARISAVRWAGLDAGEVIIDRQEIGGRLPDQIQQAEAFIIRNTALATKIEGIQHTDIPQYPRPVLREAIVNAVAHRDYSLEGAQSLLYIFDDRIELRSPGSLPNSVTLENIRAHYSKPRNETLARVLFNLGYVNTLGSGVPRMIRLMREHGGREPDFEISGAQFLVRLWGKNLQSIA